MQRILDRILPPARSLPMTSIEALQQKTLNRLMAGAGIACFMMRLVLLILGNPGGPPLYFGTTIFMVGLIVLFLMERYVPYQAIGLTLVVFVTVAIVLADTPVRLIQGESLIFFICPVALAGLLLRPWAGYVVAGIISLGITLLVVYLHLGVPNVPAFVLFFMIALIIEQSTSRLHRAMQREQEKSRELSESEEKYHRLIDLLPVGVLINQDGKVVMINPAGAKLAGARKPEEVIGATILEHVHPDYRETAQKRIQAALAEGTKAEIIEQEFLRMDGTSFFAESSGLPFAYNDRPALLVVFDDISERKRAHEAITLQNQRIQEISRKLLEVQEREKHLLAAELHDDLGQSLTSLKLMLELTCRARPSSNRQKKVTEALELVSELMNKVRNLSLELRPAMLDDFGLFAALHWLYDRFRSQTGISIQYNHNLDCDRRFEPHVETAAFRIIQEALTNIARHASVQEAQVTISINGGLCIEVADKGAGFDAVQAIQKAANSTGLSGMQERARLLGGNVEIISKPDSGTRVLAQIPLMGSAQ